MQTKTKFEEMALKELRGIPGSSMPQAINILRSLREGICAATGGKKKGKKAQSGLCGIWIDEREADEIIAEIHSHRSGFGGRMVEL
jgi:hypothetical protein